MPLIYWVGGFGASARAASAAAPATAENAKPWFQAPRPGDATFFAWPLVKTCAEIERLARRQKTLVNQTFWER